MFSSLQKAIPDGWHQLTVTKITDGFIRNSKNIIGYFELRFENDKGEAIFQKFPLDEEGKKFYIDPLFRRFNFKPNSDRANVLRSYFDLLLGKKISVQVYTDPYTKAKGTMGYKPLDGDYSFLSDRINISNW